MSNFSALTAMPPDALLGLMTAYRADLREEKYDLGVGVYKNDAGETPVMSAVAKAEARILESQTTKVYEGPRGNTDFCSAIEGFVFGEEAPAIREGRTLSFTTPGGCGALFLGTGLMKRMGVKKVWVSNPTWPNPEDRRVCLCRSAYRPVGSQGNAVRACPGRAWGWGDPARAMSQSNRDRFDVGRLGQGRSICQGAWPGRHAGRGLSWFCTWSGRRC